jgi:hypothetical protein
MPSPFQSASRPVRIRLDLLDRLERLRAAAEQRAGVPVELRTVVERLLDEGIARAERDTEAAA